MSTLCPGMGNSTTYLPFVFMVYRPSSSRKMIFYCFQKNIEEVGNSSFSTSSPRKPRRLCQAKEKLDSFFNSPWSIIWAFGLLVTLCSMERGFQHDCKLKNIVWTAAWVVQWAMWTQHNVVAALCIIAFILKFLLTNPEYYCKVACCFEMVLGTHFH